MSSRLLDFVSDPPPFVKWLAALAIGFMLVWIAISFLAGPINQGI